MAKSAGLLLVLLFPIASSLQIRCGEDVNNYGLLIASVFAFTFLVVFIASAPSWVRFFEKDGRYKSAKSAKKS